MSYFDSGTRNRTSAHAPRGRARGSLTRALWRASAQSEAGTQDADQRGQQLHASGAPAVEAGPQQDGKVSNLHRATESFNP